VNVLDIVCTPTMRQCWLGGTLMVRAGNCVFPRTVGDDGKVTLDKRREQT